MKVGELKRLLARAADDADVVLEVKSGSYVLAYGDYSHSSMLCMLVLENGDLDVRPDA